MFSGNALEKAGGREFLDGVKELRKAQAPLEVASGRRGRGQGQACVVTRVVFSCVETPSCDRVLTLCPQWQWAKPMAWQRASSSTVTYPSGGRTSARTSWRRR